MERFAVKGIFVDTPTPDTLRVRDGYMLCEDGRCGAFREAAPAGVPVYDHSGQIDPAVESRPRAGGHCSHISRGAGGAG